MVASLFPYLFAETSAVSVVYGDCILVKKSPVNPSCVIIDARYPMEFLNGIARRQGLPSDWIDSVGYKTNSDGSMSVWDV